VPMNPSASSVSITEALLSFLFILLVAIAALSYLVPPAVVPGSAPATDFSAERAIEHLKVIAREPHPTGSIANALVRDYLVEQLKREGLEPQIQRTGISSLIDVFPGPYGAGTVENILARLKGSNSTGVVLLMAHYDSVSPAPGATDDGSGVVTLLEILSALRSGSPSRNDVVIVFTDGEELGTVGVQGFVDEHPWAKEISVALNLDSGGSCGLGSIGETKRLHEWLVREIARAVPHPLTASLDLFPRYAGLDSTALDSAIPTLEGGYSGCRTSYHTRMDNLQNLDPRSIQGEGNYSLAVVRDLTNLDLRRTRVESRLVYFSFFGRLIIYPMTWVLPLMIITLALFAGVLLLAFKRGRLSGRGLGLSLLLWPAAAATASGGVAFLWWVLQALHLVNSSFESAYNAQTYALGFLALTIAATSSLYVAIRRKASATELTTAAFLLCMALLVLTYFFAPGTSFLLMWPLLFALLPFGVGLVLERPDSKLLKIVQLICAGIPVFLFTLLIAVFAILEPGSMQTMVSLTIFTVVLLALLAPQLEGMTARRKWLLPGACAVLSLSFISFGALHSGYDALHPRPDSIAYWLNADTGKGSWISLDERPDGWTSQFLAGRIEREKIDILVAPGGESVLKTDAPTLKLPAPEIVTLDDSVSGKERILRLRLTSLRHADVLWVALEKATVLRATIGGKKLPSKMVDSNDRLWGFYYAVLPLDGIELDIAVGLADTPRLTLTDQTNGLPDIPGLDIKPRTEDQMPLHYYPAFDSSILVSHSISFLEVDGNRRLNGTIIAPTRQEDTLYCVQLQILRGKDLGKNSKPQKPAKSHRINGPLGLVRAHNPKVVSSNLTPATIS
jgi:Peptidase family M28